MAGKHYLTGDHVLMESWDPEHEALRTIPAANTQFAISVSAEDNDSVYAVKRSITVDNTDPIDCTGMDKACLYANPGAIVMVSPSTTGEDFIQITCSPLVPFDICAKRIKISEGKLVMHG